MQFFQNIRNVGKAVQLHSDSGSSVATHSGSSGSDGCESDYSNEESFSRAGLSRATHAGNSDRHAQTYNDGGGSMRRPPSARSGSSHTAGSGQRRSPPSKLMPSPRGPARSTHLRSLSNGGGIVPVASYGGALVPVGAGGDRVGGGRSGSRHALPLTPASPVGQPSHMLMPSPQPILRSVSSARSLNASIAFSSYMANAIIEKKPTMNLLVVGAPQVGKSMFVNAYRAAVTNSVKWPTAPVGICGFYGTTSVEPFPNHPTEPSWMCIDTPGRLYGAESEAVLEKLVEGMPWKTKLAGAKALATAEVADLTPIAANAAQQCVVVVPATDLVEDHGWTSVLRLRNRYTAAVDAGQVVLYVKGLVSTLRALLSDAAPFVLITKMDRVGGSDCYAAREAILALMGQCVPVNRVFFAAFPEQATAISFKQNITLDGATRESLIRLHEDVCFAVQWKKRVKEM